MRGGRIGIIMKAKKAFLLWFGIIVALNSATAFSGEKTIKNEKFGFEITFPESWKVIENSTTKAVVSAITYLIPGGDSAGFVSVYIGNASEGKALKEMVETMYVGTPNPLKDYQVIKKEETKVGDINAFKVTFVFSNDGLSLQHVNYVFIHNKLLFVIKCYAKKDEFEKFSTDRIELCGRLN